MKSYYDREMLLRKLERLRIKGICPLWLVQALLKLKTKIDMVPVQEKKEQKRSGYVYPH